MRPAAFLGLVLAFELTSAHASDVNPLGVYVGGAVGQARDSYTAFGINSSTETGWKAMVGLKPIPFLGAELEYIDFGSPSLSAPFGDGPVGTGFHGNARATAVGIFAVGYLPLPIVSVYAKVGVERLHTIATGSAVCPAPLECINYPVPEVDRTASEFAYGVGLQTKFKSLAFRAEYERTESSVGNPNLLSLGITWTF